MGSPGTSTAERRTTPQSQTFRSMSMSDLRSDGHGIEHHSDQTNKLSEQAAAVSFKWAGSRTTGSLWLCQRRWRRGIGAVVEHEIGEPAAYGATLSLRHNGVNGVPGSLVQKPSSRYTHALRVNRGCRAGGGCHFNFGRVESRLQPSLITTEMRPCGYQTEVQEAM